MGSQVPNFLNNNPFNLVSMTTAINKLPNMYGRCQELGLFGRSGVTTRTIIVENKDNVLNLLASKALGSPGTLGAIGKRKVRSFVIPHFPHDDAVLPEEVQGIRAFGQATQAETIASKYAEKLQTMRLKHDITLEHMRMATLRGILIDGAGETLYNYFNEFGIVQKTIDFELSNSNINVIDKILELKRHIEDNLKGEVMSGVHVFVSPEFYDDFTTHASVQKAFQYFQTNQQLSGDYRTRFVFGGVTFEEYRGSATMADLTTTYKFVPINEGIAFPIGTMQTFKTFDAPADFNETVNTPGLPIYAKGKERDFGRGIDIHTQSNPLNICLRPELIVKITKS